jgi:murein DD-endopeptidase MepM/ murein hydrolase activator NlpD
LPRLLLLILVLLEISFARTTFSVSPKTVTQGNSFKVALATNKSFSKGTVQFKKHEYPLYKASTYNYEVIIGTTYETLPGIITLNISLYKKDRKIYEKNPTLNITRGKFRISSIIVPPEKEKEGATDWQVLAKENNILATAFNLQTPVKYFSGSFIYPTYYKYISSEYGVQRKYILNNKVISNWGHRGIDFVNIIGTPVRAPNNGIVVISQFLQVHGNTIAIDHGQGIVSVYNHLQRRYVKPGQYVKKGELIGRIGTSGLSTGAHLHFGLSVNRTRVNPQEWFIKEF